MGLITGGSTLTAGGASRGEDRVEEVAEDDADEGAAAAGAPFFPLVRLTGRDGDRDGVGDVGGFLDPARLAPREGEVEEGVCGFEAAARLTGRATAGASEVTGRLCAGGCFEPEAGVCGLDTGVDVAGVCGLEDAGVASGVCGLDTGVGAAGVCGLEDAGAASTVGWAAGCSVVGFTGDDTGFALLAGAGEGDDDLACPFMAFSFAGARVAVGFALLLLLLLVAVFVRAGEGSLC